MVEEKDLIQSSMLKYAKSVVLLSDDVTSDNAFQMLSVIKSSLRQLEKSIYRKKNRTYKNGYKEDHN